MPLSVLQFTSIKFVRIGFILLKPPKILCHNPLPASQERFSITEEVSNCCQPVLERNFSPIICAKTSAPVLSLGLCQKLGREKNHCPRNKTSPSPSRIAGSPSLLVSMSQRSF